MCGLCGILALDGAPLGEADVAPMVRLLEHRGPDGNGTWLGSGVALGHTRLAIIDLEGGVQPMGNEDGSIQIAFNGEIYNHRELRERIAGRHTFRTRSDTEVLVHLYEERGPDFVEELEGFFAIALWDAPRRRLVLARDRLGKKPLFVARARGRSERIVFGSELRALLSVLPGTPAPDPIALDEVLGLRYADGSRSGFVGIEKLRPGEVRTYDQGGETSRIYWSAPAAEPDARYASDEKLAVEEFRTHLDAAVAARLEADVPLGLLLSGGLDSTAILESLSRVATGTVRTFTVGFSREKESEASIARSTARHFGSEHEEFTLTESDLVAQVDRILTHLDEPFGDPSILPTTLVCQLARGAVTVCLGGDGGDELFGGYKRYANVLAAATRARPGALRAGLYNAALPHLSRMNARTAKLSRRLADRLATPEMHAAREAISIDAALRASLAGERMRAGVGPEGAIEERIAGELAGPGELGARMMRHDLGHYLPGLILTKVDRASMASSLEMRAPFLDRRMVEWAQTVPVALKIPDAERGRTKHLVRRALDGRVPDGLLDRRKKGFGTPLGRWFRKDLAAYAAEHLESSRLAADGWLDGPTVRRLLAAHRTRRRNFGEALWTLLALEVWYRTRVLGTNEPDHMFFASKPAINAARRSQL